MIKNDLTCVNCFPIFFEEEEPVELGQLQEEFKQENIATLCDFLMQQKRDLVAQQTAHQCQEKGYEATVLSDIKTLDLSSCKLTSLLYEIGLLTNLRELRLINNSLADLPDSMTKLTKLNTLHMEGNALKSVPLFVLQSGSLTQIYLYGNENLSEIPVDLKEKVKSKPLYARWSDSKSKDEHASNSLSFQ